MQMLYSGGPSASVMMNGTIVPVLEFHYAPSCVHSSCCMRRKSKLHVSGIENHELRREQDVAKYIQILPRIRLKSTEAVCTYTQSAVTLGDTLVSNAIKEIYSHPSREVALA